MTSAARSNDLPLAIQFVRVDVDDVRRVRQVHLVGVVRPCTEPKVAVLIVEWEVGDVNWTSSVEDTTRFPVNATRVCDESAELAIVAVNLVSPEATTTSTLRHTQQTAAYLCVLTSS